MCPCYMLGISCTRRMVRGVMMRMMMISFLVLLYFPAVAICLLQTRTLSYSILDHCIHEPERLHT